ncbi:cysteine--tRNA ligase [Thiolapillus brandeum]|uniref:Cysteine--tRNA ligase n=1 Tax=Thiolapillus brandeum TaxID=1076588 RepID=A0A7U6JHA2_9GAMM|nr:cysteine--tRNA ligase [Thiolapillus brandeum]BAO44259.1 cysteinyl-tRNA synthetase [Thiolapillus brandeum]
MTLRIYNDLHNKKEEFQPIEPGKVRMYVCGMTVYDYCHLGHARMIVVFDVVYRYLKARGYDVTYVRNITDIDDKIIQRANERGEPFTELTRHFIDAMHEDLAALGVQNPSMEPRATEHIPEILEMIRKLIDNGHAYVTDSGDVYYSVTSFPGYGKLSGKSIEDLQAGARVESSEEKRDPLDFALWKAAKPDEPAWDSPWGKGRPGWHIECSAMSTRALGDTFDIHGGGADLTFPHHENEIAQSEGATCHHFVNYWMHNGFVRVNDEKMSKSLGNFFTIREIMQHYRPEEIRYFILTSHYRSPLNYDEEHLLNARQALNRFYTALRGLDPVMPGDADQWLEAFNEAMDDDFNTPEALAAMFELVREINKVRTGDEAKAARMAASLKQMGAVLGILQDDPEQWLRGGAGDGLSDEEIDRLIQQRLDARKEKNWGEADRIRDELKEKGVILEDGAGTTTWRREG